MGSFKDVTFRAIEGHKVQVIGDGARVENVRRRKCRVNVVIGVKGKLWVVSTNRAKFFVRTVGETLAPFNGLASDRVDFGGAPRDVLARRGALVVSRIVDRFTVFFKNTVNEGEHAAFGRFRETS